MLSCMKPPPSPCSPQSPLPFSFFLLSSSHDAELTYSRSDLFNSVSCQNWASVIFYRQTFHWAFLSSGIRRQGNCSLFHKHEPCIKITHRWHRNVTKGLLEREKKVSQIKTISCLCQRRTLCSISLPWCHSACIHWLTILDWVINSLKHQLINWKRLWLFDIATALLAYPCYSC